MIPAAHSGAPAAHPSKTDATLPVLILDDERFDRHRLARLCSGLDFPCDISNACTLQEFSDQLDRMSFGLILVDYALPDGTGLDALDMVRLSARNLNAAALMISGQADESTPEAVRAIGAEFLAKDGLDRDTFSAAVDAALAEGHAPLPAQQESYATDQVETLLAHCAARSARDVKPMISRMLRQMRDLRTGVRASDPAAQSAALRAVEQNCMSLWAFLIEMEREDGAVLLADLTADGSGPLRQTQSTPQPAKPRKAPSIFSRRAN